MVLYENRENLRADLGLERVDFGPEWADFLYESFWTNEN